MKLPSAIALALLLAGCTASDQMLLQQDFKRMADLPNQIGKPTQAAGNDAQVTASADPAPPLAARDAAPPQEAVAAPAPAPAPSPAQTAPPPDMVAAATPRKKPTLFEALGVNTPEAPVEPPGAYDQIPDPIPVENPLARPPWEVFMEAGPNAHKELDLETLYGADHIPAELQAKEEAERLQAEQQKAKTKAEKQLAAAQAAEEDLANPPGEDPQADETAEPAKKKGSNPSDVVIKAVAVPAVKGAKGKGNSELTVAMRNALKAAGWPVLNAPRKDALTVQGRVTLGQPHGATQSAKIVWDVLTPDGKNLGNLKQDNAVAAGSLDQSWGDNAQYAADAAAEGIFKLIQKYR